MSKKTYKILIGSPYEAGAAIPYWIEITTLRKFLLLDWETKEVIGNYTIDSTFGELGQMPFFSLEAAEKRLKQLEQNG